MKTKYYQKRSISLFIQHYYILCLVLFCSSITTVFAQSPQKMTYQSVVRDASGNLLTDTSVGIQISILQGSASGASVYTETYTPTPQTNINGLVSLEIGGGTPSTGVFINIDWANAPYFLLVAIDPTGGTNYTISGTSQLLSVPYALYAETSGNAIAKGSWSLSGNTGTNSTNDFIGTTDKQELKFRVENEPFGELDISTGSVFFGERAGISNTGVNNIGMGTAALIANTTGFNNIGIGSQSLLSNTTGSNNIGMGDQALFSNTTGSNNISMGNGALSSNTNGFYNVSMGNQALATNNGGSHNIAMGNRALENNTTGDSNIGMGDNALITNTSGHENIGMGIQALEFNENGNSNIALGSSALQGITTGNHNIGIGYRASWSNDEGDNNIGIGNEALTATTAGNNNIGIGYEAQVDNNLLSNQVRIGNDQITLATTQIAWTTSSDKKWKEDIRSLPHVLGFVSQLKPVDYIRKNNKTNTREIGFIAQDVEKLLTKFGYTDQGLLSKDSKGNLSLRYNDLIPVLTKAIQELHTNNKSLQQELNANNKSLQKMNNELLKRIEKLEQQK